MRDPEDAIDEAYGAWLGGSGYADMQSYRDVFRDGWNAGSDHEARNCPQEGRIVALKAEIRELEADIRHRDRQIEVFGSVAQMAAHDRDEALENFAHADQVLADLRSMVRIRRHNGEPWAVGFARRDWPKVAEILGMTIESVEWCPDCGYAHRPEPCAPAVRCPHGHVDCCGHHDLEDMPVHTGGCP